MGKARIVLIAVAALAAALSLGGCESLTGFGGSDGGGMRSGGLFRF